MTRRSLALISVAVVALLAACVPVTVQPPPAPEQPVSTYCAPSTPNSAAQYQAAFDNLRRTYTEWGSADGALPVRTGTSRTVWLFGDTYIGRAYANGLIIPADHLVNNSFVLQDGPCFTPLMGGKKLARTDLIPDPAPNQWYWPAGAVVDGGALRVFLLRVAAAPTLFGFDVLDMRVVTFSLPTLTLQGTPTVVPGNSTIPLGSTAFVDPATPYVYLYGAYNVALPSDLTGPPEQRHYVARVPKGSVTNTALWEYWQQSTATWVTDISATEPMVFSGTLPAEPGTIVLDGPAAQLHVTTAPPSAGDAYLGTAKLLDAFSNDVSVFTAPTPNGPWTYKGKVADTTLGQRATYTAFTHRFLLGTSSPIAAYSTNDLPGLPDLPPSIYEYGPRFVDPLPGVL